MGNFHFIEEGELLEMEGEYTTHKLYGLQFSVKTSQVCEPEDLVSIERYLGSAPSKAWGRPWPVGSLKSSKKTRSASSKKSRSVWQEIKGSANGRHGRSPYRRRKKRYAPRPCCTCRNMVFRHPCGKDLSALRAEHLAGDRGKPLPAGR